jgi:hypothetical protein
MNSVKKTNILFVGLTVVWLSSCSTLDIKPWSDKEIISTIIGVGATNDGNSYGSEATCANYRMTCGHAYREWRHNGEIACSCRYKETKNK